jgi:hypothetical protein
MSEDKYVYDEFHPQPDDYFQEYNESFKQDFDNKHFKYQALTFKLFTSDDGKKWLKETKEQLNNMFADATAPNYALHMASLEGARKQLYNIELVVTAHKNHLAEELKGQ